MTSPFKRRKKERRRLLAHARKNIIAAEEFEKDGTECKSSLAAVSRRMAEVDTRLARAKRRKKKSKPAR